MRCIVLRMLFFQCYPTFQRFDCKVCLTDALRFFGGACRWVRSADATTEGKTSDVRSLSKHKEPHRNRWMRKQHKFSLAKQQVLLKVPIVASADLQGEPRKLDRRGRATVRAGPTGK